MTRCTLKKEKKGSLENVVAEVWEVTVTGSRVTLHEDRGSTVTSVSLQWLSVTRRCTLCESRGGPVTRSRHSQ